MDPPSQFLHQIQLISPYNPNNMSIYQTKQIRSPSLETPLSEPPLVDVAFNFPPLQALEATEFVGK